MIILSQNKHNFAMLEAGTIQSTEAEIYFIGNGVKLQLGRYYNSRLQKGESEKIEKIIDEIIRAKINGKPLYEMPNE